MLRAEVGVLGRSGAPDASGHDFYTQHRLLRYLTKPVFGLGVADKALVQNTELWISGGEQDLASKGIPRATRRMPGQ